MSAVLAMKLKGVFAVLKQAGWVERNGNTWESPNGTWLLKTAYCMSDVTLELVNAKGKTLGSTGRRYYRGAHPLTWLATESLTAVRTQVAKVLDTESLPD